jgi:hypothetical protein
MLLTRGDDLLTWILLHLSQLLSPTLAGLSMRIPDQCFRGQDRSPTPFCHPEQRLTCNGLCTCTDEVELWLVVAACRAFGVAKWLTFLSLSLIPRSCFDLSRVLIRHVQRVTLPYASRLGCTGLFNCALLFAFRLDDIVFRTHATTLNYQLGLTGLAGLASEDSGMCYGSSGLLFIN